MTDIPYGEPTDDDFRHVREEALAIPDAEDERRHIANLLGQVIVHVRMGEITYAQIDERLNHIQFLLDHPNWSRS